MKKKIGLEETRRIFESLSYLEKKEYGIIVGRYSNGKYFYEKEENATSIQFIKDFNPKYGDFLKCVYGTDPSDEDIQMYIAENEL